MASQTETVSDGGNGSNGVAQATRPDEGPQLRDVIGALKDGLGARAIGVFDDDLSRLHATTEPSPEAFWDGLGALRCLRIDWPSWYSDLRWEKHLHASCTCDDARHHLHTLFIHRRWALLVVTEGPLPPAAQGLMVSVALVLARLLPETRIRRARRGGRGPEHARVGIPVWWMQCARKTTAARRAPYPGFVRSPRSASASASASRDKASSSQWTAPA